MMVSTGMIIYDKRLTQNLIKLTKIDVNTLELLISLIIILWKMIML